MTSPDTIGILESKRGASYERGRAHKMSQPQSSVKIFPEVIFTNTIFPEKDLLKKTITTALSMLVGVVLRIQE